MQTTEHYELNLAEGSDTVNPLVIDVPNYETIDEAMYTNYLGTVGLATELLSGSVHALTREGSTPMFRFTATANWTAGDTVTVDGTQVTAKLPTGAALGTGAYVINSEVLCCLNGTLLTIFVPAGSVTTADDSLKLGGQLPEYYGTASAVQTATNVANAASLLVEQLSSDLSQKTTIDISDTDIPSGTPFQEIIQMLAEKVFPKFSMTSDKGTVNATLTKVGNNAVRIRGTFTVTSRINVNDVAFNIIPLPSGTTTLNSAWSLVDVPTTVRNFTLSTDGSARLTGPQYCDPGVTWNMDFTYNIP